DRPLRPPPRLPVRRDGRTGRLRRCGRSLGPRLHQGPPRPGQPAATGHRRATVPGPPGDRPGRGQGGAGLRCREPGGRGHRHRRFAADPGEAGEILACLSAVRACVRAAEADAAPNEWGVHVPALDPLQASMTLFPRLYPRMVELLQLLASSGLVMVPSERDVDGPLAGDIARYFRGADSPARERIALFRLASDLALNSFGGRQVLYERFY